MIELVPFALSHQREIVIKSPSDGSSKNVTIGREVDETTWGRKVEDALCRKGYIVQDFVMPPLIDQPVLTDNSVEMVSFCFNLAAFIIDGNAGGSCLRGLPVDTHMRISCALGAREGVVFVVNED
jgi:hypothetical protein